MEQYHFKSHFSRLRSLTGFTLIEVMAAVSILSFGTVMIAQSNLTSLKAYGRYVQDRLSIQNWAEERIWEMKQKILESETPPEAETSGKVPLGNRTYQWKLDTKPNETNDLYAISLDINWTEGSGTRHAFRNSYVVKLKK